MMGRSALIECEGPRNFRSIWSVFANNEELPSDWHVRANVHAVHLVDSLNAGREAANRAWMAGQIRQANEAFFRSGNYVSLVLSEYNFVVDPDFRQAAFDTSAETLRQRYHPGIRPYQTLFVVVAAPKCTSINCISGAAYFPTLSEVSPTNHYIWMSETAPDDTLGHELGHVLNLPHTFHRQSEYAECSVYGDDGISDTAMERMGMQRCLESPCTSDSCPGQEGCDPCNNIMSYHEGANNFTFGQMETIKSYFESHPLAYAAWSEERPNEPLDESNLTFTPTTASPPDDDNIDIGSGLSAGAIAGISAACAVVLAAAAFWSCQRKRESKGKGNPNDFPTVSVA